MEASTYAATGVHADDIMGHPRPSPLSVIRANRSKLFDVILRPLMMYDESLLMPLLHSGSKLLYQKTTEIAYELVGLSVVVPGPEAHLAGNYLLPSKVATIADSPRLAKLVKRIAIFHPPLSHQHPLDRYDKSQATELSEKHRQDSWKLISWLINSCLNVQSIDIQVGMGVGEDIWRMIANLRQLTTLKIRHPQPHPGQPSQKVVVPRLTPSLIKIPQQPVGALKPPQSSLVVCDGGWTLGPAWDGLKVLELANLSLNGVRTLTTYFYLLSHQSRLVTLNLSSQFLDLSLCTAVASVAANLVSLTLSTSGSKFTGECLRVLLEGCPNLELFILDDVEGRLEQDCWSTVTHWPPRLRWFEIIIDDREDHYSWAHKHLDSIHLVPISQLRGFVVRRRCHPLSYLPLLPPSTNTPPSSTPPDLIPARLLSQIQADGANLRYLCVDWWDLPVTGPNLFHSLKSLATMRISIRGSMQQMISKTKETLLSLQELHVISLASYNAPNLTKNLVHSCNNASMPPEIIEFLQTPDSSLPEIRDLRKLIRKMPHLRILRWSGRDGKGKWDISRKSARMADITFTHAAVVNWPIYQACQYRIPEYPFEEVPQNANAPAYLSPPNPSKPSSSEFLSLSKCTTLGSPPSPLLVTPPTHVDPVLQDPSELFSRLSVSHRQNGSNQILRLDNTKTLPKTASPPKRSTEVTTSMSMRRSTSHTERAVSSSRDSPEKRSHPAGGGKRRVVSGLKSPPRSRPALPVMMQDGAGPSKQTVNKKGSPSGSGNGSGSSPTKSKEDKKSKRSWAASEDGWTLVGQSKRSAASGSSGK